MAAAGEIQQRLAARNAQLANHRRMEMRIGINLGDVLHKDGALYGDGVNIAAPGGICVSRMVRESVENKLDIGFEDLGEHEIKNIAKPVRAYRVVEHDAEQAAPDRETPLALPDKPSIAVLPFANMSGDAKQDVVGDGLAEDVIVTLSQLSNLFVIARQSSFVFKDRTQDARKIGRRLGVRYVLDGSVRKSGHRLRVTAELVDRNSGEQARRLATGISGSRSARRSRVASRSRASLRSRRIS